MTGGDGFEAIKQIGQRADVIQVSRRHRRPVSDELLIQVRERTTWAGRAIVFSRGQVQDLCAWLGRWLEEGWDGVTRS